jgi:hypothetical protein
MHARLRQLLFAVVVGATIGCFFADSPLVAYQSPATSEDDLVLGTWILDVGKSSYDPGPAPRSQTRTYERVPEGIQATIVTVDAKGQSLTARYTAKYDSLEYPLTGSANIDAIALKRVNAYTAEATLTHARKLIGTARRVISNDGKTMTITFRGTDENGRATNNVAVYEKKERS